MTEAEVVAYVKASAAAQGLALDDARVLRVAAHLARTVPLAQLLDAVPLGVADELAETYSPKPFATLEQ